MKESRRDILKLVDRNIVYGDSFITRLYTPWKDKSYERNILNNLKLSWQDLKVVIIEGKGTRSGIGNDLFDNSKSLKRIICPNNNAWEQYEKILSICLKQPEDSIFYIALGPTATVLAYELSNYGYRALDLGHLDIKYEQYLRKDTNIGLNKNDSENSVFVNDEYSDIEYEKSIICRLL